MNRRSKNPCRLFTPLFAVLLLLCIVYGCAQPPKIENLRLSKVGPFSATIQWETQTQKSFQVVYGEGSLFDRTISEKQAGTDHRISMTGLKPSTRYFYRIEPGWIEAGFRSAPGSDGAFDLVVLDEKSPACKTDAPEFDVDPDVVILAGHCAGAIAKRPQSIFTIAIPEQGATPLAFGRHLILAASDIRTAGSIEIDPQDAERSKIVVLPALPAETPESRMQDLLVSPRGTRHLDTITRWDPPRTLWLEIDAFEVAWVHGGPDQRERKIVVEAPPETKKTCLYCDRLLESGRYEESLAWYRDFIANHQDRYEVEDAMFSIAQILDEKLFTYTEAIREYEKFLARYPKSRRRTLARYRLDYLAVHSDGNFEPLEIFERAKAGLSRFDPLPTAAKIESLLKHYPESTVAEDALLWLGNLLESTDPDRARIHYKSLIERFPSGENAAMAAVALGDILYREKRYRSAIGAYERASQIAPETYRISITDKIRKSRRNIKREAARIASWVLLAAWLAVSVGMRARPDLKDARLTLIVLASYAFIGGTYFAINYESTRALLPAVSVLVFAMCGVLLWNRGFSRAGGKHSWIVIAHAFTCSIAVLYLVMYRFHYLYVFGI